VRTPLGDFVRAKRDRTAPEDLGLPSSPAGARRRAPGLRRSELAARAGISVEYLTRIEQGRDRNPSGSVVTALADALSLDPAERRHLAYLAKIAGGACARAHQPEPPRRQVRPQVLEVLRQLEPAAALVTNRLGDVLACTASFRAVMAGTGLLDGGGLDDGLDDGGLGDGGLGGEPANLTRFVFTDPRARDTFPDWGQIADELAFSLWLGPSVASYEWFRAELAPVAGPEFTRRLGQHLPPAGGPLRMRHPAIGHDLRWHRETLELSPRDEQQLVIYLPADQPTSQAVTQLSEDYQTRSLRAV
jgi:transcriptional regulator with XRE-family HTH domain